MTHSVFNKLTITNVKFLPIVKEYARRVNLVETVNHMVGTQMELQPGPVVLAMVLDTLSGRSPLYQLIDFFEEKDTELLLGKPIVKERFTDHNVGRALDKMFETGTQKPIKETEKIMILQALETTNGNKRKAAHIPRSIFYNKLKEYRIGL